jgi:4-hydroxy-tetrahydrodipicolinate reductase
MKLAVLGATGRMGSLICNLAIKDHNLDLVSAVTRKGNDLIGKTIAGIQITDNHQEAFLKADLVIDFSNANSTIEHIQTAQKFKKPLLVGVTGADEITKYALEASQEIAIMVCPNTSILVNVINQFLYTLGKFKKLESEIDITDIHHKNKKDAPSGTALMFGETICKAKGLKLKENLYNPYDNKPRKKNQIGIVSHRISNVAGEHIISFFTEQEKLEIKHSCFSREVFAKGAIEISKWLYHQKPKLYNMNDFINDIFTK